MQTPPAGGTRGAPLESHACVLFIGIHFLFKQYKSRFLTCLEGGKKTENEKFESPDVQSECETVSSIQGVPGHPPR